ncbi:hypothetical protein CC80DRAFT_6822 [Byssothecium circinans]|uniref:Uncharacterized protein n=1 Tax=Byssothecium circinans TaxID=147558 RepID=A0A6A5UE57_9PLEO|nr:hypothetical protein CC80DRAFT_6822 [Byssothecium circinans]
MYGPSQKSFCGDPVGVVNLRDVIAITRHCRTVEYLSVQDIITNKDWGRCARAVSGLAHAGTSVYCVQRSSSQEYVPLPCIRGSEHDDVVLPFVAFFRQYLLLPQTFKIPAKRRARRYRREEMVVKGNMKVTRMYFPVCFQSGCDEWWNKLEVESVVSHTNSLFIFLQHPSSPKLWQAFRVFSFDCTLLSPALPQTTLFPSSPPTAVATFNFVYLPTSHQTAPFIATTSSLYPQHHTSQLHPSIPPRPPPSAATMNCLHIMGEALTIVEPHTIYPEAKRQYEASLLDESRPNDTSSGILSFDLSRFYRMLFNEATRDLNNTHKSMLQHVCFAYKTKSKVMEFLDALDTEMCPWAEGLLGFVREFGRDTNFRDGGGAVELDGEVVSGVSDDLGVKTSRTESEAARSLPSPPPSQDTPVRSFQVQKPYFIIPTLPLAIPAEFFSSLARYAPVESLNVETLLSYPSALQLALSDEIKEQLKKNLPDFWKPKPSLRHGHAYREEKKAWKAFFGHLMVNEFRIFTRKDGRLGDDRGGYTMVDLSLWLARRHADRVVVGTSEQGWELRRRLRQQQEEEDREEAWVSLKHNSSSSEDEQEPQRKPISPKKNETAPRTLATPTKQVIPNNTGPNSPEAKARAEAWNERKAKLVQQGVGSHELVERMLEWTRWRERMKTNQTLKKKRKRIPGF